MSKSTNTLDSVEFQRAKWAQNLTNQYLYTDLASKERAFFTPEINTPTNVHARQMKVVSSEVRLLLLSSSFELQFITLLIIKHMIALTIWLDFVVFFVFLLDQIQRSV